MRRWPLIVGCLIPLGACFDFKGYEVAQDAAETEGFCGTGMTTGDAARDACLTNRCCDWILACQADPACAPCFHITSAECDIQTMNQSWRACDAERCTGAGGGAGFGGTGAMGGTGATGGTGGTGGSGGTGGGGGTGGETPTCANTCSGCCEGTSCVPYHEQSTYVCGSSGDPCQPCAESIACTAGACDSQHWSPDATLRLGSGLVEVSCSACLGIGDGSSDPQVSFEFRGRFEESGFCTDNPSCDYSLGQYPFVVENMYPDDFTSGETKVCIWDDDATSDDLICCFFLEYDEPFERLPTYVIPDTSICTAGNGSLTYFRFELEAM